MKTLKTKNGLYFLVLLTSLLFISSNPGVVSGAGIPLAEDVVGRKAKCPTIEELTGGRVKKGDIIDASNMDMVKAYLTVKARLDNSDLPS